MLFNQVNSLLSKRDLTAKTVIAANHSPTICELVAGGLGVSPVHPLLPHAFRSRVTIRPFAPEMRLGFLLCYTQSGRSGGLVNVFLDQARTTIGILGSEITAGSDGGRVQ